MTKGIIAITGLFIHSFIHKGTYLRLLNSLSYRSLLFLLILLFVADFSFAQQTNKPPNILVIVLDDARYDMFQPNGGPAFFKTPSINRIAEEGVNFKYTMATTSFCVPSRASIYTGLYPHHHGAIDNLTLPKPGLNYISTILQNAGYYTGFIGKWLLGKKLPDTPIGFSYWAITDGTVHINPKFIFNDGSTINFEGHEARIYTDLAIDFLENVTTAGTGNPWMLFFALRVPHDPYEPLPEEDRLYQKVDISFPDNFYPFKKDFPSYLYPAYEFKGDSTELDQVVRDYYETCHAAEYSIDSILNYLEESSLLDSTLIVFTSDNGYMFGEHYLFKKELAYNESIRLPLFIRYPAWFSEGTIVDDEIAANIDIAPTLLAAAGIPDTFHMDGVSLLKIATGELDRKYFLYENYSLMEDSWDAVCSFNYKYIYSYCNSLTEEFFDLNIDPEENTNLIFDTAYASLIQEYRDRLESLRTVTGDTIYPVFANCYYEFTSYEDFDGDGFGNAKVTKQDNELPTGYELNKDDCNDSLSTIYPGAAEVCNQLDDDCNALIDENAIVATIAPSGIVNICSNSSVVLSATNSGSGISYQWLKNNNNISGATLQTYTAKKAGNYTVKESNNFNCSSTSAAAMVNVITVPDAIITPLGNLNICLTQSVALQANAGTGYTYQWQKGTNLLPGSNRTNVCCDKRRYVQVTVTNGGICSKKSLGTKVTKSCKSNGDLLTVTFSSFHIFPNPINNKFTIEIEIGNDANEQATITIQNQLGQIIFSESAPCMNGEMVKEISLNNSLADGVYFVRVNVGTSIFNEKLIYRK